MGRDYEEEEFVGNDDTAAAYWKSLAKRLKAKNGVLRERVTAAEASAVID